MEYICDQKICLTLESSVLTKSTFLLIKYSVPTILIELRNLFGVKGLNVKFSKYQKQWPEGAVLKRCSRNKGFAKFIQKYP